jgi:hypothetical protein
MNAADHQHLAVFFNFPLCLGNQSSFTGRNFARFQRAAKGAGQSACRCGNNIIQRSGMRFVDLRVNTVMLGDFGMNTKQHRLIFLRQIGAP